TAGNADRLEYIPVRKVEPVRIDEILRVGDLAAERDGIAPVWSLIAAHALADFRSNGEIAYAIRGLGQLPDDAPRGLECLMRIPERAGRTKSCKLQPRRTVPLGDVSRPVEGREEHRHALHAGPLQGRKTVRHLLEACSKPGRQQLKVVSQLLR